MRKKILAVLGAMLVFGLVSASAASLGGLTTPTLGADDSVVASCDTDGIDVAYTLTYSETNTRYEVASVDLTAIAVACAGLTVDVTLADSLGVALDSGTAAVAGTSQSVTIAAGVSAEAVEHIAVVIAE